MRCSTACTRAGLLALVMSLLALLLIQPLRKEWDIRALGRYVSLRLDLSESLKELDQDPCWKALTMGQDGKNANRWPLSKLHDIFCSDAKGHPGFEITRGLIRKWY